MWLALARRQREEADLASCAAALAALLASADKDRSMPLDQKPPLTSPTTTCLARPPVEGCNCGLVLAPAAIAAEHGARVLAQARLVNRSTAASVVLAHAAALRELAPTLHWTSDRAECLDLAQYLTDFARQLPVCDGGEQGAGHA